MAPNSVGVGLVALLAPLCALADPPPSGVSAMARSGGWLDGNFADFFVGGQRLNVSNAPGFKVAVLDATGAPASADSFDVHDSAFGMQFSVFVDGLPVGVPVLLALQGNFSAEVDNNFTDAMTRLGAKAIGDLQPQGSYALIGVMGGQALAEQVMAPGQGYAAAASLCGRQGVPGFDIGVQGAGFLDGNLATFSVRGSALSVNTGRGLNVVALDPSGAVFASYTFALHAGGAAPLIRTLAGLPVGTLLLVAVQDDGFDGLSSDAKAALAQFGASLLDSLSYRASYALVGVKGAAALAETWSPPRRGPARIKARYGGPVGNFLEMLPSTTTTTTATTTPVAQCTWFDCPSGQIHKADVWNITGDSAEICCEAAAPGVVSVAVASAGFGNGNDAQFHINGRLVDVGTYRGINVLELRPDGGIKQTSHFDTFSSPNGSQLLATYLNGLEDGTVILVAARDEASNSFVPAGRAAIAACGGTSVDTLGYRSGYALVGVKGSKKALSETVVADHHGFAFASAHVKVVVPDASARKPLCPARTAEPPVHGWMSNGQLELDAGCRYSLFESEDAARCLAGGWVAIIGGSNTVLMGIRLANMLAPDAIMPVRDRATMGGFAVVDVIIDGGAVTYRNVSDPAACSGQRQDDAMCTAAVQSAVQAAPPPSATAIRITLFSAQFADQATIGLSALVAAAKPWVTVPLAILLQVGTWDIYCAGMRATWCPRPEMIDPAFSDADAMKTFADDMSSAVTIMAGLCAPGQRAGKLGCVVGTNTFQNPAPQRIPLYERYNAAIRTAVQAHLSDTFRLVDFWVLGQAMPEENVLGHGSPMLNLWNWQVMLSGMCDPEFAAEGTSAKFEGVMCFGAEARADADTMDKCPDYRDACPAHGGQHIRCEPWECANSLPCKLVASAKEGPPADLQGMCSRELFVDFAAASYVEGHADPCREIWCAKELEWLPAVAAFVAAVVVYSWGRMPPALPRRLWRLCRGQAAEAAGTQQAHAKAPAAAAAIAVPEAPVESAAAAAAADGEGEVCGMTKLQQPAGLTLLGPRPTGFGAKEAKDTEPPQEGSLAAEAEDTVVCIDALCATMMPHALMPSEVPHSEEGPTSRPVSEMPFMQPGAPAALAAEAGAPEAAACTPPDLLETAKCAAAEAAPPLCQRPKAGDKFPLGLARYCASLHVVVGHLYARGVTPNVYFFGWGFTWVPWFFMLSGFVLFAAHLRRPKQEGVFEYVIRRSVSIYPLYAVSLIPAFAIAKALGQIPDWQVLVAQSFLVQAWWPAWTEQALQSHCWFLSAMVVYWLLFRPLSSALQRLTLRGTVTLMIALFALPWLIVIVPAAAEQNLLWYQEHTWGATGTWTDFIVVFLKFHPFCYLHVFVLGMLLAKLRLLLDVKATASAHPHRWTIPLEFIAPAGYLGLILIFCVPALRPWAFKLSARLSVLLPFQAAILFGLAGLPSMTMSRMSGFFTRFNFLENYSYAVYVFQFIAHSVWPNPGRVSLPLFYVFLMSSAYVASTLVQQPVQKCWGNHPRGRLLVPVLLAGLLAGLSFLPGPAKNPDLPALVRLDERMIDVRLPLVDVEDRGGRLMNPSWAVRDGRVLVAARRHKMETSRRNGWRNGSAVVIVDETWHSQVLLGSAAFDAAGWAAWPTTGTAPFEVSLSPWYWLQTPGGNRWDQLCARETWVPQNQTIVRQVVTGPEDAKVFEFNGSTAVAFSSLPPLGNYGCRKGEEVSQMYLASDVHETGDKSDVADRLTCGLTDVAEKNWIPFTYRDQLHFVYSPMPHEIVVAGEHGSCETAYSTDFAPLVALHRANPSLAVRGSGQAVFVNDTQATPNLPRPHYLAALHMVRESTNEYAHFAYRFSAEPPFNVLQVSTQLPLIPAKPLEGRGKAFAFVNGLTLQNGTVAISYGAGDRDARALVLTLTRLDEMFACPTPTSDPNNNTAVNGTAAPGNSSAGEADGAR